MVPAHGVENEFLCVNLYVILLVPINDLKNYKSREMVPLKCEQCNKMFHKSKNVIQAHLKNSKEHPNKFCSNKCVGFSQKSSKVVKCHNCGKEIEKQPCELKKSKKSLLFV